MDLKRMRYFCTIAEQGQISRAARLLHIAQPPLSQRLRELETEFGCDLFTRKGRGLQLTEAGKLFYRHAREILNAVEEARDEVIRAAAQIGPALRIGLSPTCKSYWMSRFPALHASFPERQIGLVVGDSGYLESLLLNRQLDVALMQPPAQTLHFTIHRIASCKTVAVAPAGLLPDAIQSLSLAELARHPLLLLRRSVGVGSYERLIQLLHDANLNPQLALYSSDVELLLDLLRQGFAGIAVVPETETGEMDPGFTILPIEQDLPDYHLSVVSLRADQDDALIRQLLDCWSDSVDAGCEAATSVNKT